MAVRAMKNWRDASGIIVLSGALKYARAPTLLSKLGDLGENPLIVPLEETGKTEWEVALVKRSSKTGFFANSYVFPGGRLDAADSSPEWQKLFSRSSSGDPFRSILAPSGSHSNQRLPGTFPPAVKTLERDQLDHWRDRVHNDATEFLNLCSELRCVPDIWSLLEWSDWLTPRNFHIRYDSVFYLCVLDTLPPITADGSEIVDAKWYTPSEALQLHADSKIVITPPQFVDIHVLKSLGSVPCLHSYALRKNLSRSLYRHNKIRILTKDKVTVSMIDLDDLYPALPEELALTSPPPHLPRSPTLSHVHLHPSQSPAHEYECPTHTADELRNSSTRLCRMESHGKGNFQLYDTIMAEQITSHVNEYNRFKEANQLTSRL
ncbi:Nucleoside diphosphate-linked moiety X motif 19 [Geodia barretti]|uniref:Nucleoside diphosphate-linked moiety X motif 19 n=1 Tax=Geodia barretti TaxID=519541 RepID=A0AA35TZG4_GEOBA|nr:Nucleoside diphosphate-linked moiety X motif 19 [Geodia barretti]